MSFKAVGEGRFRMGVINPVRLRAIECLKEKRVTGARADAVRAWVGGAEMNFKEWNWLVEWVDMPKAKDES